MAYTNENIIVGAADVFVGKKEGVTDLPGAVRDPDTDELTTPYNFATFAGDTARPAFAAENNPDWRHVGLTQGGVELAYAPDFGEVDVDQYLDVAKMFKQRQSVTVNTTFAEATLENLLFAWGQPEKTLNDGTGYRADGENDMVIHGGALGDKPVERSVVFIGQAPSVARGDNAGRQKERVYYLARALNVESSSHTLSKTEATVIPAALRCLPVGDLSSTVAYGRIIERFVTGAPTPTEPDDG